MDALVQLLERFGGLASLLILAALAGFSLPILLPMMFISRGVLRFFRWPARGAFVLLLAAVVGVGLAGTMYVNETLHWALAAAGPQGNFQVQFDHASGNLFAGKLTLTGLKLGQENEQFSQFQLECKTVQIDVVMEKLLQNKLQFTQVAMNGLHGTWEKLAEAPVAPPTKDGAAAPKVIIDQLTIRDSELTFIDHTALRGPLEIPIQIDSLVAGPITSDAPAYAIMCQSQVQGRLMGENFTIRSDQTAAGRNLLWECEVVPLQIAAAYFQGPFEYMSGGRTQLRVESQSPIVDETAELDLHWNIVLNGLSLDLPNEDRPMVAMLGKFADHYLSEQNIRLPVSFELPLPPDVFQGEMMPLASSVWKQVGEKVSEKLASRVKIRIDGLGNIPLNRQGIQDAAIRTVDRQTQKLECRVRGKLDGVLNRAQGKLGKALGIPAERLE